MVNRHNLGRESTSRTFWNLFIYFILRRRDATSSKGNIGHKLETYRIYINIPRGFEGNISKSFSLIPSQETSKLKHLTLIVGRQGDLRAVHYKNYFQHVNLNKRSLHTVTYSTKNPREEHVIQGEI